MIKDLPVFFSYSYDITRSVGVISLDERTEALFLRAAREQTDSIRRGAPKIPELRLTLGFDFAVLPDSIKILRFHISDEYTIAPINGGTGMQKPNLHHLTLVTKWDSDQWEAAWEFVDKHFSEDGKEVVWENLLKLSVRYTPLSIAEDFLTVADANKKDK